MVDAWATVQDVLSATGVAVTDQQLAQAQDDIQLFSNRLWADTDRIRPRDVYWLGRAVVRQAAWRAGQFGVEARLSATQINQDGVSSQLTPNALVLAPMAERALNRCSWRRSRTVHVRSPIEGAGPVNALLEASDDTEIWEPVR